ncbi:hypothetical protein GCM10027444_21150 [Actinopolyspora lacussalsi]
MNFGISRSPGVIVRIRNAVNRFRGGRMPVRGERTFVELSFPARRMSLPAPAPEIMLLVPLSMGRVGPNCSERPSQGSFRYSDRVRNLFGSGSLGGLATWWEPQGIGRVAVPLGSRSGWTVGRSRPCSEVSALYPGCLQLDTNR